MSNDVTQIQSVVYETSNLGVKVIPFNSSESIMNLFDACPESSYVVFSERSIDDIANIYDKIVSWVSPERKVTEKELEENVAELDIYLGEKLISTKRHELLVSALTFKLQSQQEREENV